MYCSSLKKDQSRSEKTPPCPMEGGLCGSCNKAPSPSLASSLGAGVHGCEWWTPLPGMGRPSQQESVPPGEPQIWWRHGASL